VVGTAGELDDGVARHLGDAEIVAQAAEARGHHLHAAGGEVAQAGLADLGEKRRGEADAVGAERGQRLQHRPGRGQRRRAGPRRPIRRPTACGSRAPAPGAAMGAPRLRLQDGAARVDRCAGPGVFQGPADGCRGFAENVDSLQKPHNLGSNREQFADRGSWYAMRIILLALTIPLLAAHSPLQAQSDAATRALIQQLSRVPNVERGIRFSAPADAGAPAGQSVARPVAPALPASEQAAAVPAARAPQVAEPRRRTTAPADVPSASITVTFPSGSAELTPAAEAALLPLGRALSSQDLDAFRFRIEGHTDRVGPRDPEPDAVAAPRGGGPRLPRATLQDRSRARRNGGARRG
jgi:outer membrane protein OmpA-like peptidoglycan-associated protein